MITCLWILLGALPALREILPTSAHGRTKDGLTSLRYS